MGENLADQVGLEYAYLAFADTMKKANRPLDDTTPNYLPGNVLIYPYIG